METTYKYACFTTSSPEAEANKPKQCRTYTVRCQQRKPPLHLPEMRSLTDVEHCEAPVMEGNNEYLPHEIIVNILQRLPVKSLIRFQCMCKNWKNLLKDPLFIADHLHHYSHRPSLLLLRRNIGNKWFHLCSFDCDFRPREVDNTPLIDYMSSFKTSSYVRIIGSSNGLLCVELSNRCMPPHNLVLWNPAIKEVREVPRTIDFTGHLSVGFGFSTIANDYKIIKIYGLGAYYDENRDLHWGYKRGVNKVLLYSLGTGLWKDLEYRTIKGVHMYSEAATASNGAIIWVGQKWNDESLMIVSFDIEMELFTLIPIPALHPSSTCIPTFYENRIAILSYHDMLKPFESCFIDLWVIDEENTCATGGRWSWTKKYSGSPYLYPYLLIPENIWRNEIVCKVLDKHVWRTECETEKDERENVEYDQGTTSPLLNITTNKRKKFVFNNFDFGIEILNYVESLVPVRNLHIEES